MKKIALTCLTTLVLAVTTGCGGGGSGAPDTSLQNVAPVADAGSPQTVAMGALVQLNGTASRDANNDPISYAWNLSSQPSGSTARISGPISTPTFTADLPGKFVVTLNVNDGKLTSTSATVTITVAEPSLNVAGLVDRKESKWAVSEVTSQLTGNKTTLIRLFAFGGTFSITCERGQFTGYYLDTDSITANGAVAYRVGATNPITESWNEASNSGYKRLTPSSFNINFLRSLYLNTDFYFLYNKFGGGGVGNQFTSSGFPATIDATRDACGWSQTMFPADNGWGLPYPTVAPATAIEPTYSLTAFSSGIVPTAIGNYFRVLAWKENNSQGRPQLLVRVGDSNGPCVGALSGPNYNSYYVTQNGKTVAAVRGTSYAQACTKPEIYPLNGDFDAGLPFTLSIYGYHFTDLNMGNPFATIAFN